MLSNLESALKIDAAAQDTDMAARYQLRIFGDTNLVSEDRAAGLAAYSDRDFDAETRHIYGLTADELRIAKIRCISETVGIQLGREFFNAQA